MTHLTTHPTTHPTTHQSTHTAWRWLWLLPLTLLISACASGPQVKSDYDHNADFAAYRTFAFMQPLGTDRAGYTTLLTQRLKTLARLQMEQRVMSMTSNRPICC